MPGLIQVRAGGVDYVVAPPEGALAVGGVVPSAAITATATYPLSVHASGRCLVTPGGTPFLLLSDSPQGMLVCLSTSEMSTYFSTRANQGFNAAQVHVTAGSTFGENHDVGERKFVKMNQSLNRLAGEIHKGLRFGEDQFTLVVTSNGDDGFGLHLHSPRVQAYREAIHAHETKIVASAGIFAARVAKSDQEVGLFRGHD